MHIPDGYLGPQTCVATTVAMVPLWTVAARRLKDSLRLREVPMLALGAAFSFLIMMFNVPIPGGTTGHAVGAVVVAILLGPWAATVAVSLALVVQALVFGDGGVTAIGANCLDMAVVLPFVGWGVYRVVAGNSAATSPKRVVGAALGGYLGLAAAATVAGILFGLQPLLSHDAAGRPLYCPFGLRLALPAMMLEHLLVFGFVEAIATALVVRYMQTHSPESLVGDATGGGTATSSALVPRLAAGLGIMILLSPLGLWLPEKLHAGSAWGEWSADEAKAEMAKVGQAAQAPPAGLARAEEHGWKAPMPDYALPGQEEASLTSKSLAYILSGAVGVLLLGGLLLGARRLLAARETSVVPARLDDGAPPA